MVSETPISGVCLLQGARFDFDEAHAVCRIEPGREEVRAWKAHEKEKKKGPKKPADQGEDEEPTEPKAGLVILDLTTGAQQVVERVKSFRMPDEAGGWVAYRLLEPEKDKDEESEEKAEEEEEEPEEDGEEKKKDKDVGTELVLRGLDSGDERRFEHVVNYAFSKNGAQLAFTTSTEEGDCDGVFLVDLNAETEPRSVLAGEGEYKGLAFDEQSAQLAFLSNRDDYASEESTWSLYLAPMGAGAELVAEANGAGLPSGWTVSPDRNPEFSDSGGRLLFGSVPIPEPEPEELDEEDRVVLDVWSWTDERIQPMQLSQREEELKRSYLAVAHLTGSTRRVVQLGGPELRDVSLALEGDSGVALGIDDSAYRPMVQWDPNLFRDVSLVDVASGVRRGVLEGRRGRFQLSPGGRYVYWWDGGERQWFALPTEGDPTPRCLTASIPHPLWNELHDTPSEPRAHGVGGWLNGDVGLIVYDRHDLWLVDPTGETEPYCVTEGVGRREGLRFRRVDTDPDEPFVSPMEELLLSAFHLTTKRAGFFSDRLLGGAEPVELIMADRRFGRPVKARGGDVLRLTVESFEAFPDLHLATTSLTELHRVSNANPQQSEYRWGTAALHGWRSNQGEQLQGILYRPDDFDPSVKYPLLVYFYERMSDGLYRHNDPVPSRSSVRFSYYTSNGYCVFVPDIPYRTGYPGASCADAVLPGILSLIDEGFIDEHAIGVQGHSWGGYQIAYLVTQTNLFTAAIAGAPVSNMTSAYGGIRWSSGMSRQWQYERSQSRLGGTLWEVPNRYFENSPLFFADKVETPLLMLHNDEDGAVPWYQGIEYFVALRRLDKPVWLLNYNGEGHGIGKYSHKRDYAVRMSQFFDHYLREAPAPAWMVEGVPAVKKGRTLGLELTGVAGE